MQIFVGPFFVYKSELLYDKCVLEEAEKYGEKITNPLSHSDLYDMYFIKGEYMEIPRGRVVWDILKQETVIYIDKCINNDSVIDNIVSCFAVEVYTIDFDEHYVCPGCWDFDCLI